MRLQATLLVVRDITVSKDFYRKILQQELLYDFGENITFQSGLSIHERDHFIRMTELADEIVDQPNNTELYFETEDIESFLFLLNQNKQIKILHPVKEHPWCQRVVRFYDPDGHLIEVGESMRSVVLKLSAQGHNNTEIATITQHPLSFVDQVLQTR